MRDDEESNLVCKVVLIGCSVLFDVTHLGVVLLENGAIVVSLFRHGCVLGEAEGSILEQEIGDVLVSVVSQ